MANRLLLCLVIVCVLTDYSICGRFSSRGRSGGSSRSSWSWGGGSRSASKPSSSRHNYPSSSGSSSLSGSGKSSHSYPSSLSGLSGLPALGGKNNYPPSSSGLSGSSSGSNNKYPPSSGLSGFGSGSNKYPPSHGLSGAGTPVPSFGSNLYPPTNVAKHNYPTSSSGGSSALSGLGSGSKYPPSSGLSGSGSGSNKYPPSHGLSGAGTPVHSYGSNLHLPTNVVKHNYYPTSSGTNSNPPHRTIYTNTHSGIGSGNTYNSHNYYNSYASAPQHIYITEYRNSNSRYSDILTGLALYNMGRSHTHYNHHYYNDDYYTRRYYSTGSSHPSNEKPDDAYCTLRIKENNKLEVLKIPCEIVSTFTEGSKKLSQDIESETVCVSNHTVINNTNLPTVPASLTVKPLSDLLLKNITLSENNKTIIPELPANISTFGNNVTVIPLNASQVDVSNPSTIAAVTSTTESSSPSASQTTSNTSTTLTASSDNTTTTSPSPLASQRDTISSSTVKPLNVLTSNITVINSTKCTTTRDPLTIKGPPLNPRNMECEVEIITKTNRLRTKVDCNTLTEYSKMPEPPKKESSILPSRSKLKSWLASPPWWISMFIAL